MLGLYPQAQTVLENVLQISQSSNMRRESAYARLNLGLVYWRCQNAAEARSVLERAQCDLQAVADSFGFAAGLSYLAHVLEGSADFSGAQQCYHEAHGTFIKLGVLGYAADASAGMARCALALGDREGAGLQAEAIWIFLQGQGSRGLEFPVAAYLTCLQVFNQLGQSEKGLAALQQGCQELHQRAQKISDLQWRSSFLENIPEHQAILDAWDRLAAPPVSHPILEPI
jgi:tetratricopeptide (TPR) repeat protein